MTISDLEKKLDSNPGLRRYGNIRDLIASPQDPTPLLRLNQVVDPEATELYMKLEWFNPFGSIKDRAAKYILESLEREGKLDGRQLVEPTSGNMGIALAALAALKGIKLTVTVPEGVPEEKRIILRMLGAEVWATPDELCPVDHPKDGAIALAHSFVLGKANQGRYLMPDQYANPDNVRAHYETTGPEIWDQTEGRVRYLFAGLGTCGTISGIGRFLKEKDPRIKIIGIEPQKGHKLPGLKNMQESKQPVIMDRTVIDEIVRIKDEPAYEMTKKLFREEGLVIGPSTGAVVQAAIEYVDGSGEVGGGVGVVISPDSGFKYTSYFDCILGEEGKPIV
ncbi:PLP-dependent cysteine synthase family protein [candidate division KSB1 bacterium]